MGRHGDTVGTRRRRYETPGQKAATRIGEWPASVSKKPHGIARQHAWSVWTTARTGVCNRAQALWVRVDRDETAFLGQVDLVFLATVAGHLRRCPECSVAWVDGEVPMDLLTAAVRRIPAWAVFQPVLREMRSAAGRSGLAERLQR